MTDTWDRARAQWQRRVICARVSFCGHLFFAYKHGPTRAGLYRCASRGFGHSQGIVRHLAQAWLLSCLLLRCNERILFKACLPANKCTVHSKICLVLLCNSYTLNIKIAHSFQPALWTRLEIFEVGGYIKQKRSAHFDNFATKSQLSCIAFCCTMKQSCNFWYLRHNYANLMIVAKTYLVNINRLSRRRLTSLRFVRRLLIV